MKFVKGGPNVEVHFGCTNLILASETPARGDITHTQRYPPDATPPPLSVETRVTCPRGGVSPQSHDVSECGSSTLGTSLGWYHERPPVFEPAPFTPNSAGGQPTQPSTSGGLSTRKAYTYVHPEAPTGIRTQPVWHTPRVIAGRRVSCHSAMT